MDQQRRNFIARALYGVLALFGAGYLSAALRVLSPARRPKREAVFFPLIPEEDVPRSGVKKTELTYQAGGRERRARVFVVADERELTVFSAVCSHLGCLVNYHRDKHEFICPCHGGRYDLTGRNIGGPPPAPLTKLPHKIENGMVLVGMKV